MPEEDQQLRGERALALLALTLIPGMGNRRIGQFVATLAGHGFDVSCLVAGGNTPLCRKIPELATQFEGVLECLERETLAQAESCICRAEQAGLTWVHLLDEDYPKLLLAYLAPGAPPVLFLLGDKALLEKAACAVVGTRSPSRAGTKAARHASEMIVGAGMAVVSGGASGVDWAAHDAALQAGGSTLVFLPQGIRTYGVPVDWRKAMDAGRLLLASEYLPEAPWRTYAAVSRNALIAAQARLVCVIEPRKQGGSILTARHAVEQGKRVLVEPVAALPTPLQSSVAPLGQLGQALDDLKNGTIATDRPGQSRLF